MKMLLFASPVFKDGKNLTVRAGIKWSLETEAIISDLDRNVYGTSVLETHVMRFCDLEYMDLSLEHEPGCRTLVGLRRSMKRVYPHFDEREIVTLVYFNMGEKNESI